MQECLSSKKQNFINNLSPEEQAKLDVCINPDAGAKDGEIKFRYDGDFQNKILCMLWKNADALSQGSKVILPGYFTSDYREKFCKLLFDYYKEYGGSANKDWLLFTFKQQVPKMEDAKTKTTIFEALLNTISANFEPELHERKAILDMVQDFARHQAMETYTHQLAIATCENNEFTRFDKVNGIIRNFALPALSGATRAFSTWAELLETAASQSEDWLIPNWSEFGCVTLFSSLPKLGKSTIVAELVACAMTGREFYGQPLNPAPVLLVDPENREKTLVRRLNHAIAGEVSKVDEWFFRLNAFPKPLDNSYLRKAIEAVKAETGQERVIVVLDTLRSCYTGAFDNENDNAEMSKIVVPLKDLAAETGVALLLVHHNNKSADSYAGGTAILGSVDYWWNWKNDRAKRHGELSCWGRGDFTDPIELTFDTVTQRNRVYAPPVAEKTGDNALLTIPVEGPGVTRDYLAEVWGCGSTTAHRRLAGLIASGVVEAIEPTNPKLGKTHYRKVVEPTLAV